MYIMPSCPLCEWFSSTPFLSLTAPISFSSKTEEKQKELTNCKFNHSKELYSTYTSLNRSYLRSVYIIITKRQLSEKSVC